MPKLAEMVPAAISLPMLFALSAAGGTIALLWWRSTQEQSRRRDA
jgi:hypothetical protein